MTAITAAIKTFLNKMNPTARLVSLGTLIQTIVTELNLKATVTGTETLTNKTLTAPVVTSPDVTFGVSSKDYGGAAADWTLSAAEMKSLILTATNASGAVNAIATPTNGKIYVVANAAGHALTLKAAGQAGIAVANAKTAILRGNGTDFVRVTADA